MVSLPESLGDDLARLDVAVSGVVPARTDGNLLIATWNLRAFGGVTPSWDAPRNASPKRDWRAVACVAQIVSHFDVVAVQEVRRDTSALRFLLSLLGTSWRVIVSDVTEGGAGNGERLTYLYDASRVQPSGLVGEIVLPSSATSQVAQFARSPYAASFVRGETEFILSTVHVLWGSRAEDRLPEITAFANWMRAWAERPSDWNANLMVLGDFNLDRIGDPLFEAFVSTGLWPPAGLADVPRTIFDKPGSQHFYDQIAWFSTPEGEDLLTNLAHTNRAGSFDFVPHVLAGLTRTEVSWRISDHYPLWVEFEVTG